VIMRVSKSLICPGRCVSSSVTRTGYSGRATRSGVRENDGRKLDHRTLEVLRLRAVEQVQAGAHPEQVAAALGLHRKTVYGWLAKFREGGRDALVAKPVPGRPPKLPGCAAGA
jgi:transposase-like protein